MSEPEKPSKTDPDRDDPLRWYRDQRHNEPKSGEGWRKILGKPKPPPDEGPLEPEYLFSGT